jgi:hypothetical protein
VDKVFERHLQRIEASVLKRHSAASIAKYITENTKRGLDYFSYANHEFQPVILSDTSQEVNVQKCSQVGLSEVSARMALALVNVISPYTIAYTLPTAKFAATFMKTRIDPIIRGSDVMKDNVSTSNDNSEFKEFGDSYLYLKGAASSNAPISIPCDHLVHDEVDFSDQEVLGQYTSRLTHSAWKRVSRFSTPTLPDFGINRSFKESRRHYMMARCCHCNHWFLPNYYDHVRIPGYKKDLRDINKQTLTYIAYLEAAVHCPRCGGIASMEKEHREVVCENPGENFLAAGYQVQPFDAPKIILISDLVKASTKYERRQDFDNFNLGLPAEDSEATLQKTELEAIFIQEDIAGSAAYVMGVDCGATYHFQVDAIDAFGDTFTVWYEQVPMGRAKIRYRELLRQFRVLCTVIDSAPHAETVMGLQQEDQNLFASVYVKSKGIHTHVVVDKEEVEEEGKEFVRQVNVNRSRALDSYMNYLREGKRRIRKFDDATKDLYIAHHTSMKRVKVYDNESGEMVYSWQKSDGEDHFHHAGLYAYIAGKIRGVGTPSIQLPTMTMMTMNLRKK